MNKTPNPQNAYSELYAAYASGTLDPAFCLLVETQNQLRNDVMASVQVSEMIAGLMLERSKPVEMENLSVDSALAVIDRLDQTQADAAQTAARAVSDAFEEISNLPDPLCDHAIMALGDTGWKNASTGVKRLTLDFEGETEVELYRIAPGAAVPRHSHAGNEYTLVVSGGFTDENGSYGPGDMTFMGPEDTHKPVGDAGEPCYALAIRDAGLRFTGARGLVQRVLGR